MMLLILKPDVVTQKKLTVADQEALLQDVVDEVRLASAILNSAPSFAIAFPMPVARAVPLVHHSCANRGVLFILEVPCKQRPYHAPQEYATGWLFQGSRCGRPAAGTEGVCDDGLVEKGD